MAKWSEMPVGKQLGIIVGAAAVLTVGMYFLVLKTLIDQNEQTTQQLTAVRSENESLRPYQNKLADLERQIESLKQQLEIQKRIVPDEKEEDQFIRLVQATAATAGIEVRSYNAKPTTSKEFFVEAPFDIELDGPYYSVLTFFDKLAKLDRIINISGLSMATVEKPQEAKVKRHYTYAPAETVIAGCTATTYFSHEGAGPAKPATGLDKK